MNLGLKNKMAFQGTVVSNAFIDTYMTAANGGICEGIPLPAAP